MYISDFRLLDILREKMGDQEARTLIDYIETRVDDKFVEAKNIFSTKEDLLKLELKISETIHKNTMELQKMMAETRAEMLTLISESKIETQNLIADSKAETQKLIADSKFETIKWLFGLILASTIGIIGTILTVMKMGGW